MSPGGFMANCLRRKDSCSTLPSVQLPGCHLRWSRDGQRCRGTPSLQSAPQALKPRSAPDCRRELRNLDYKPVVRGRVTRNSPCRYARRLAGAPPSSARSAAAKAAPAATSKPHGRKMILPREVSAEGARSFDEALHEKTFLRLKRLQHTG